MIAIDDIGYVGIPCQREISIVTSFPRVKSEKLNSFQVRILEIIWNFIEIHKFIEFLKILEAYR